MDLNTDPKLSPKYKELLTEMANEARSMISPYGHSGDFNVKRIVSEEVPRLCTCLIRLNTQHTLVVIKVGINNGTMCEFSRAVYSDQ
ncbi:hypothetical protein PGT21_012602 [Puccinia graminis f. sp. tritici]|uniref:Uncharacterized protein n=1 Tax=Puccinia graminis f. sp. tritici TaxID=56615 RepID=A0A5B0QUJ5_PUCGR|nr:hypothetical protein PGT21_012602 [Puccinia graminis f. sp. tritici]